MLDFILNILSYYIILINLIGFLAMAVDKFKSKIGAWRTTEATLFLIALIGGSIGSIAGMFLFRHKTRHLKFLVGMPLILIIQYYLLTFLTGR